MQNRKGRSGREERQARRTLAAQNMRGRFMSLPETKLLADRSELWEDCVERIGRTEPVRVLEFGVFRGKSMAFWSTHFTHPDARFHGFDSFEGLPERWTTGIGKGHFSTGGAVPALDDPRVTFHKGWFQNTLPGFLESFDVDPTAPLLVHVDVDVYSAALFCLTTLWHYIPDYFVVFDEFGVQENLALGNLSAAYPVAVTFFSHTLNERSGFPRQVFGRVSNTVYDP